MGLEVAFAAVEEGENGSESQICDHVLQAVGCTANCKIVAAEMVVVTVADRGLIDVDIQMRTKVLHEAHGAAEVVAGELPGQRVPACAAFNTRAISSVACTDP